MRGTQDGCNALMRASMEGRPWCVRRLLEAGVAKESKGKVRCVITCRVQRFISSLITQTPLLIFIYRLIKFTCLLGSRNCQRQTQGGDTALILAAEKGHFDCVRLLLEAGADKDAANEVCWHLPYSIVKCVDIWVLAFFVTFFRTHAPPFSMNSVHFLCLTFSYSIQSSSNICLF